MNKLFATIAFSSIFAELFLSYFSVGLFPLRNYIMLFGVVLLTSEWLSGARVNNRAISLTGSTIFLILSLGLLASMGQGSTYSVLLSAFKMLVIPFFVYKLTLRALQSNSCIIYKFVFMFVSLVSFSALIAVLQYLDLDFAWQMRNMMPIEIDDLDSRLNVAIENKHRPVGMAYYSISLGYQIIWAFPLAWYWWVTTAHHKKITRLFAYSCMVFLLIGCAASETRSALIGVAVQIGFLYHFIKPAGKSVVYGAMMLFMVGLLILGVTLFQSNRWAMIDASVNGKPWLVYLGLLYAIENPFGQGFDWSLFFDKKLEIMAGVSSIPPELQFEIEINAPHNQFINTAVMYGWLGLGLAVSFFWLILRKLYWIVVANNDNNSLLAAAVLAGFVGYIINSLTHNAGLFVGDVLGWYFVALAEAVGVRYSMLMTHRATSP